MKVRAVCTITKSLPIRFSTLVNYSLLANFGYINFFKEKDASSDNNLLIRNMKKIGFGGGCHWCTEAIFQALNGVESVEQGWISSLNPYDTFSEAVIVHFNASGKSDGFGEKIGFWAMPIINIFLSLFLFFLNKKINIAKIG